MLWADRKEYMNTAIVITTIFDNEIVEKLFENIKRFGHLESTSLIIIPDKKTPRGLYEKCRTYRKKGFRIMCPTLNGQESFLKKLDLYPSFIPYNTDNRRNVGYLMALESCDLMISMDDDNFPTREDFVGGHRSAFEKKAQYTVVSSSQKMYNPMTMIEYKVESPKVLYPRGFPYKYRTVKHSYKSRKKMFEPEDIFLNAGLWLEDPDIDGITWIVQPARAKRVKKGFRDVILAEDTWTPINTQNTTLRADAIAAYWFVRMNYPVRGMMIDRYGDIFSGYFVEKCIKALGRQIKFGRPLAIHKRNAHNYFKDITGELACIIILEDLVDWLMEVKLQGNTFCDVYESLSQGLEEVVEKEMKGVIWDHEVKAYFHYIASLMRTWTAACKRIRGGNF
jgi:hypothetical protein